MSVELKLGPDWRAAGCLNGGKREREAIKGGLKVGGGSRPKKEQGKERETDEEQ